MTTVKYGKNAEEHNYTYPELGYTLTFSSGVQADARVVIVELDTLDALLGAAGFVKEVEQ